MKGVKEAQEGNFDNIAKLIEHPLSKVADFQEQIMRPVSEGGDKQDNEDMLLLSFVITPENHMRIYKIGIHTKQDTGKNTITRIEDIGLLEDVLSQSVKQQQNG